MTMDALDTARNLADEYLAKRNLKWPDLQRVNGPAILLAPNDLKHEQYSFSRSMIKGRYGLFVPYLDPKGEMYVVLNDGIPSPYGVLRLLGEPVKMFVAPNEEVKKVLGPYGRPSQLHFAPIPDGRSWMDLPAGTRVIHCESAIKAEVVTRALNEPCIGYSGVTGYSSNARGIQLIHEFVDFNFASVKNVILFDSDVLDNENVTVARERLCHKLRHILVCPEVYQANLPQKVPGTNWGADDFLVERGVLELQKVVNDAVMFQDEEHPHLVQQMNKRLRWLNNLYQPFDIERRCVVTVRDAANAYANVKAEIPGKQGKKVVVQGFKTWLESVNREFVDQPAYEYMGPAFFEEDGRVYANTYRPGGYEPVGVGEDMGIIGEMLSRLFKPDDLQLLRSYLKFGKFTGHKPTSYCIMYSGTRGVGKGWFTDLVRGLFGAHNVGTTTADGLAEKFNAHTINIRVLLAHEFKAGSGANKKAALNYLKSYIGDEIIPVRAMNQNFYQTKVKALVFITTNDKTDMPSDGLGDRRQWYIEAGAGEGGNELSSMSVEWWDRAWRALKNPELMGAFSRWVQEGADVDFRSWRPPVNEQREEDLVDGMATDVQSAYEIRKRALELGVRATTAATIRALMTADMGHEPFKIKRAFGTMLKQAGWVTHKDWLEAVNKVALWLPEPIADTPSNLTEVREWERRDREKWTKY